MSLIMGFAHNNWVFSIRHVLGLSSVLRPTRVGDVL